MIRIQPVKLQEIPEVKELLTSTWIDTYRPFLSDEIIKIAISKWHDPKILAQQAQDSTVFIKVAKDDRNKIVGVITATRIDKDNNTTEIGRLYVHPDNQRQGIGNALMEDLIKSCPGVKRLRLKVGEQNIRGKAFWLKQGFKEIDVEEENIGDEVLRAVIMEKSLAVYNKPQPQEA